MSRKVKHKLERLQYADWTDDVKSKLILVAYSMSGRGNICGYYRYTDSDVPSVYHWMNDTERDEFLRTKIKVPYVNNIQDFSNIFLNKPAIKPIEEVRKAQKYGDVFTTEYFKDMVENRCIIDDDGCGYFHDGTKETKFEVFTYYHLIDKFPYVCWYNK